MDSKTAGNGGDVEAPPDPGTIQGNPQNDDQLPTYQQVVRDSTGPPPTYESMFGKVKEAKQESSDAVKFFLKIWPIIVGSAWFTLGLCFTIVMPASMFAMGFIYKDSCPADSRIPLYLWLSGVLWIKRILASCCLRFEKNKQTCKMIGLDCILFGWFITGNVWIYQLYGHFNDSDETASNYCNPTLYYFAFWITTSTYFLIGTMCFCICCGSFVTYSVI